MPGHFPHLAYVIPVVALMATGSIAAVHRSARAAASVNVQVNAGASLAAIPSAAFGANTAVWDGNLLDAGLPGLLAQAGITALRFPGGSTSDGYHWQTNSITPGQGGYANPNNTFDAFMHVAQLAGAHPIITVNYGSNAAGNGGGDPVEAAGWVRYANVTKHYGITYWEIGNEVYGSGTYPGWNWELDLHASKGPAAYANNVIAYAQAMKAVDPTVHVGAVILEPGAWPDGVPPDWNSTVLSTACSSIDFVIVHWYPQGPGSESDAVLLNSPSQIAGIVSGARAKINQYCGARAGQIQILVTETNSVSSSPGKQSVSLVNALFLADNFPSWLERGVTNVDWWDVHNSIETGNNNSAALYGGTAYGDYGILSDGTSAGGLSEPPAETPFPPYYGLQMLTHLGKSGDHFVTASSSQNLIAAHAVRQLNGDLSLLLVNKDPNATYSAQISIAGYTPTGTATVYSYGKGSTGITVATGSGYGAAFPQSLAPYSLTTIVLHPGTQPTATATPNGPTATHTNTPTPTRTATPSATATTAAAPVFTQSTTVLPSTVAPNAVAAIHTIVTNTGGALSNGIVDVEVYNAGGAKVAQQWFGGVNLAHGGAASYAYNWTAPATTGIYTVMIGVFGPNWSPDYFWSSKAGTITVAKPTPVVTQATTFFPARPVHGTATRIHAVIGVKGAQLTNGVVNVGVYNASGALLSRRYFSGQTIKAGQSAAYDVSWVAAGAGDYMVTVGVTGPAGMPNYLWVKAGTITAS